MLGRKDSLEKEGDNMSLKVWEDLEQGTEEWLQARCGIVTASTVGQLITTKTVRPANNDTSRGLTASLVAERLTGYVEPVYVNADMERGNITEPYARDMYAEHTSQQVNEIGFMLRAEEAWRVGYSPDGLVGEDGLIEIKAPRQKSHLATILADEVPAQYMAQCQAGLLVSGREWIDFISYCGGMPLFIKRVYPDQKWRDAITQAAAQFEEEARRMIALYYTNTTDAPIAERIELFEDMEFTFSHGS
jgi:putative phage-type endonuclease